MHPVEGAMMRQYCHLHHSMDEELTVWHNPVQVTFTRTSPFLGGPTSTVSSERGFPASQATAALHEIGFPAVDDDDMVVNLFFKMMIRKKEKKEEVNSRATSRMANRTSTSNLLFHLLA